MQPSAPSSSGGGSGTGPALTPRLSGGLSFREVGDWFQKLGDDLGSAFGLPRGRSVRRSPAAGSPSRPDLAGGQGLPATSILAKRPQVRPAPLASPHRAKLPHPAAVVGTEAYRCASRERCSRPHLPGCVARLRRPCAPLPPGRRSWLAC